MLTWVVPALILGLVLSPPESLRSGRRWNVLASSTSLNSGKFIYRVSHETWQLINGLECRLPYTVLDIKGWLQFISFKKSFAQVYFTLKLILLQYYTYIIFLLLSLVLENLTNYGRRHSKLFTNCHVSWDTLYFRHPLLRIEQENPDIYHKCNNMILEGKAFFDNSIINSSVLSITILSILNIFVRLFSCLLLCRHISFQWN